MLLIVRHQLSVILLTFFSSVMLFPSSPNSSLLIVPMLRHTSLPISVLPLTRPEFPLRWKPPTRGPIHDFAQSPDRRLILLCRLLCFCCTSSAGMLLVSCSLLTYSAFTVPIKLSFWQASPRRPPYAIGLRVVHHSFMNAWSSIHMRRMSLS